MCHLPISNNASSGDVPDGEVSDGEELIEEEDIFTKQAKNMQYVRNIHHMSSMQPHIDKKQKVIRW